MSRIVTSALLLCFLAVPAWSNQKLQGWTEQGGVSVVISGTPGSVAQRFQQSFRGATITVYAAGTTTLSTIYSDNLATPTAQANPFTANSTTGAWSFYASSGRYDVRFSGGGIASPFTLGDFLLFDSVDPVNVGNRIYCNAVTGANFGAKFTAAVALLPSTGGIVDCSNLQGTQTITSDVFTVVSKPVTLILGAATITLSANATVPNNITIIGNRTVLSPNAGITLTMRGPYILDGTSIIAGAGTTVMASGGSAAILTSNLGVGNLSPCLSPAIAVPPGPIQNAIPVPTSCLTIGNTTGGNISAIEIVGNANTAGITEEAHLSFFNRYMGTAVETARISVTTEPMGLQAGSLNFLVRGNGLPFNNTMQVTPEGTVVISGIGASVISDNNMGPGVTIPNTGAYYGMSADNSGVVGVDRNIYLIGPNSKNWIYVGNNGGTIQNPEIAFSIQGVTNAVMISSSGGVGSLAVAVSASTSTSDINPRAMLQGGLDYGITMWSGYDYTANDTRAGVFHNAYPYNNAGNVGYKWLNTNTSLGTRGIMFDYGGGSLTACGIIFYADVVGTTKDAVFTPTQRACLTNGGDFNVSSSTSAKPVISVENTNADSSAPRIYLTKASVSPANNDEIGNLRFYGNNSSAVQINYVTEQIKSTNVTAASEAGQITWYTFVAGSETSVMTLAAGLQLGAPTGGDKGSGTLNVATNIYLNNTAYANPDFVLERWATGKIEKFANNTGAKDYRGITPLSEVGSFSRQNFYLPQMDLFRTHDRGTGLVERFDLLLLLDEEEFIHLIELEKRIKALEAK